MVRHLAGDHTGSLGKARERSQVPAGREHPLPGEGARSLAVSGTPRLPQPIAAPQNFKQGRALQPPAPLRPQTNIPPRNTGGGCRNQFGGERLFNQV